MANFSNSFTGKGTGIVLEGGGTKAQEGLNKMVLDAEKLRYETFQKNKSEFFKNARFDPAFILSKSAKEYIGGLINNFNETYGKKAKESSYNLSFQDQMDMGTMHDFIESEKSGILADQELLRQQKALIDKDMGVHLSSEEFLKAEESYLSGDKKTWDYTLDSFLKPIDFGDFVRGEAAKEGFNFNKKEVPVGYGMEATEMYNIPEGEEGRYIISKIGTNPQADKDFWNKWSKADKEYYFQLADINKDKAINKDEEKNAIALWAKDTFTGVRQSKLAGKRSIGGTGSTPTELAKEKAKQGNFVPSIKYGDVVYNNSYGFEGGEVKRNIPTMGAVVLYEEGKTQKELKAEISSGNYEKLASGNVAGRLLLYNPEKDVLVFETVGSSESAETQGQTLVEVPANNITGVDDLTIVINGVKGTVGELRRRPKGKSTQPTTTPTKKTGELDNLGME